MVLSSRCLTRLMSLLAFSVVLLPAWSQTQKNTNPITAKRLFEMRSGQFSPAASVSSRPETPFERTILPRLQELVQRSSLRSATRLNPGTASPSEFQPFDSAPYISAQAEGNNAPVFASAVADFDRAKGPDVVTVQVDGTLNLLANDGHGQLSLLSTNSSVVNLFPTIVYVEAADLNRDGRPDIVAMDAANSVLYIFLNRGDGTFSDGAGLSVAPLSGAGFQNGGSFAIGDVNGDKKLDIVVVSNLQAGEYPDFQTVFAQQTYLGNGRGTFQKPVEKDTTLKGFLFLQYGSAIALADTNRDGRADIIMEIDERADIDDVRVVVSLGNGHGRFRPIPSAGSLVQAAGNPQSTLRVADLNGDGCPDAIFITRDSNIRVAMGKGNGTLGSAEIVIPNIFGAFLLQTADFNSDHRADLLVYGWGNAAVFRGDGRGKFDVSSKAQYVGGIGGDQQPVPADFNNDGRLDFVWVDSAYNKVAMYAGNGDGAFAASRIITPANRSRSLPNNTEWGGGIGAITIGDFDGDGKTDVLVTDSNNSEAGSAMDFAIHQERAGFRFIQAYAGAKFAEIANTYGWLEISTNTGDFNEDGKDDVILVVPDGLLLALTKPNRTSQDPVRIPLPVSGNCGSFGFPEVADVNGDGHQDLVTSYLTNPECGSQNGLLVSLGDGQGHFASKLISMDNGIFFAHVVDINNDGKPDVLIGLGQPDSSLLVAALPGMGDGNFDVARLKTVVAHQFALGVTTGDYNHDGLQDVAVMTAGELDIDGNLKQDSAGAQVLRGKGDFTFAEGPLLAQNMIPLMGRFADLNGDGYPELLLTELANQQNPPVNFGLMVFPNLGGGTFGFASNYILPRWSGYPDAFVALGDFNDDGSPDVMVGGNRSSAIFLNRGAVQATLGQSDNRQSELSGPLP
jgi:hypothetical protein